MKEIFEDIDKMNIYYLIMDNSSTNILLGYGEFIETIGYDQKYLYIFSAYSRQFKKLTYNQQKQLISYLEKKFSVIITSADVYNVKEVIHYSKEK